MQTVITKITPHDLDHAHRQGNDIIIVLEDGKRYSFFPNTICRQMIGGDYKTSGTVILLNGGGPLTYNQVIASLYLRNVNMPYAHVEIEIFPVS